MGPFWRVALEPVFGSTIERKTTKWGFLGPLQNDPSWDPSKMAQIRNFNLSRMGELLNTLRIVHSRPPEGSGGVPRGTPPEPSPERVSGKGSKRPLQNPLLRPPTVSRLSAYPPMVSTHCRQWYPPSNGIPTIADRYNPSASWVPHQWRVPSAIANGNSPSPSLYSPPSMG